MKYLLIFTLLFFSACSIKTAPNEWQYKSANAFSSYTQNFLKSNDVLAKNDLDRAVQHAKKSADLTQLARIYLGECALNISVGVNDSCEKYTNIQELLDNRELDAYYAFLTLSISRENIKYLPSQYQEFAQSFSTSNFKEATLKTLSIEKETSRLLCASLLKDKIENTSKRKFIETASYNGYKKTVLFWLGEILKTTKNQDEVKIIQKKISILKSK
ncbi:hypothetical protein N9X61_02600 [Sulfurimonas sp.]|nr:hypothetical protein [Sulfurimonas sp.]